MKGIPVSDFFALAFGRAPSPAELQVIDGMFGSQRVESAADAHQLILAFDAQSHPTPFVVRATGDNFVTVDLGRFALWLDRADSAVSAVIQHEREWEPHVTDVLVGALQPGSAFVDIGANVGYHTFLAASIVGTDGSVLAVEAQPENSRLLEMSKAHNGSDNVTIMPVALDREPGLLYLSSHLGSNAGLVAGSAANLLAGLGAVTYATTLDEIAPPRVDVMKIDVEGAEFRVLEGGRKTIERDKPLIVMEFSVEMSERVSGGDAGDALQGLLDLSYSLFVLDRSTRERRPFASAAALLEQWGDPLRIEDLLLEPA